MTCSPEVAPLGSAVVGGGRAGSAPRPGRGGRTNPSNPELGLLPLSAEGEVDLSFVVAAAFGDRRELVALLKEVGAKLPEGGLLE